MENNKQIKYGAIISYISIIISAVMALFYLPWMTKEIGQSNYGLYTLANSYISFLLVDFGLGSAIAKYMAQYRAENNVEKENAVFAIVVRLFLFIDCIVLCILVITFPLLGYIYRGLTSGEITIFRKLFIIVGIFSVVSFPCSAFNGVLTAHERFIELKICDLGQKLLSVILVVISLVLGKDVVYVVSSNAISGIVFILVKLYFLKSTTKIRLTKTRESTIVLREVLSFSAWTAIIAICQRFYFNFAPTILGIVSSSKEIAIFSPANALEGYFYMFAAAVNGLFLARISRYISRKQEDRIYPLMLKVGRYQLFIIGLVFIVYCCIGKEFISQWMGGEYEKAFYCGLFLFLPDYLGFTQQIGNTAIVAKNYVKGVAIGSLIAAIACVLISFVISRFYGALGASISISIGYFISFVNSNIIMIKKLKLPMGRFYRECYLSFILPLTIVMLLGIKVADLAFYGWRGVILKGMIISGIYIGIVFCLALEKSEKKRLTDMLYIKRK